MVEIDPVVIEALNLIAINQDTHTQLLQAILAAVTAPAPASDDLSTLLKDLVMTNRQVMQGIATIIQRLDGIEKTVSQLASAVIRSLNDRGPRSTEDPVLPRH